MTTLCKSDFRDSVTHAENAFAAKRWADSLTKAENQNVRRELARIAFSATRKGKPVRQAVMDAVTPPELPTAS